MVEKGLNALGVDPYKEKVVIKPNLIINRPYPVTASPKTVECIVNFFKGKTKEIIIAEGSGMCRGGTNKAFLDLGYFELAEKSGIKLVDLNSEDPVAADAVGANILGLNPLSVPHLKLAQEKGLGIVQILLSRVSNIINT